ncbi:M14 family metallopeptidase [Robbsia andropogonis]|uniref:M14 family metallopeptidase n=1 Tax=Robbsia andropogonis TaxID=28092 RepID=UPI00046473B7|nr:M14-type cytosolic carboxypeptidase [Robbsia andropogonis]MCP1116810.1 M14-type cytosolic carboxypeptidase [Robbsia andropogonis]MCP1126511.1 M14-type cytosolic carboxypeptidase [Robbsia andropogonis]
MTISINSRFDSGAVDVVDASRPDDVRLRLRPDNASAFAQWFHFRVNGVLGKACRYTFENASEAAYPDGWRDYRVVASHDSVNWFRVVDTRYDGQVLQWHYTSPSDTVWFAYFEPYGEARHHAFLGEVAASGHARCTDLGMTLQGRPLTCVHVETADAGSPGDVRDARGADATATAVRAPIWMIARQHPGETMAEWFVEGFLRRLLGLGEWAGDPVGRQLRERATFHIVPNMNPDGAALGNLRTNACGANLNREWMQPSAARSPEVLAVRDAIAASGISMFFDIHGDEALPWNFVAGSEMLPDFSDAQRAEQDAFIARFKAVSPDFQNVHGYEAGHYNADALTLASKYIGNRYRCLSLTLEMPFKDNADLPDPVHGWNGARSMALGAAMCLAILRQLGD